MPKSLAEEGKETGDIKAWYENFKAQQVVVQREIVARPLSERQKKLMATGLIVVRLSGWRARIVWKLLRLRKAAS